MPTVTQYPTTDAAVSGAWTLPANVQADDGAVASLALSSKNNTFDREQGGYGFDGQIPIGATIDSVTIEVEHRVTSTSNIAFLENYGRVSGVNGGFMVLNRWNVRLAITRRTESRDRSSTASALVTCTVAIRRAVRARVSASRDAASTRRTS